MVIHAGGGEAVITVDPERIVIVLEDRGPGIADIEQAMQEGFSTAPDNIRSLGFGAGMGLPNMKRYADEMKIESELSWGGHEDHDGRKRLIFPRPGGEGFDEHIQAFRYARHRQMGLHQLPQALPRRRPSASATARRHRRGALHRLRRVHPRLSLQGEEGVFRQAGAATRLQMEVALPAPTLYGHGGRNSAR